MAERTPVRLTETPHRATYTSDAASEAFAKRLTRQHGYDLTSSQKLALQDVFLPAVKILQGGRRIPDDTMRALIRKTEAIFVPTIDTLSTRLIVDANRINRNPAAWLRQMNVRTVGENLATVTSFGMDLDRDQTTIYNGIVHVSFTPHTLARFFRRTEQHYEVFRRDLGDAIAAALFIGVACSESGVIAIATPAGLLCGSVGISYASDSYLYGVYGLTRNTGIADRNTVRRSPLFDVPSTVKVGFATFIDRDSLTHTKARLFDALTALQAEIAPAAQQHLDHLLYDQPYDGPVFRPAMIALRDFCAGPEWRAYTAVAR